MEISYRNYTNGSAPFLRGYRPGDVLIAGWAGTLILDESLDVFAAAERVFVRHNRDDRPDGLLCPSMSTGDVVVIGETALTVESIGFTLCEVDPADVVSDLSWRRWITTDEARAVRAR
jgi:hypothetical protein